MNFDDVTFAPETTWKKFADLLVDTGVVSDCIELRTARIAALEAPELHEGN
jgi:hypothetical protein